MLALREFLQLIVSYQESVKEITILITSSLIQKLWEEGEKSKY